MKLWIAFLFLSLSLQAQTNSYEISFDNAVHHEAIVKATFPEVKSKTLRVQMSRSSPGRYAIHEFAKNVYGFKATNGAGEILNIKRDDPYSWIITNTDGTINVEYILFANRGGGTYSQVDLTHAHLNMPATFMYAETLQERPIEITLDARKDLDWKVATQL
ncbi:MAG TPA: peptidase M61, partial [Leeuwenhoekiella sp.]|nr:peptidase M61 [Leeuwenhoekiella sp.]